MIRQISSDELVDWLSAGKDLKIVDVLSREHFDKEHIKGAISIPVEEIGKRAREILNKTDEIVVYCASFSCQASTRAAESLINQGFDSVFDYKGGLEEYKKANLPLEGSLHQIGSDACQMCCC